MGGDHRNSNAQVNFIHRCVPRSLAAPVAAFRVLRSLTTEAMTERTSLILLPGLLLDAALWQAQLDALTDIADMTVGDLTKDDTMADMARSVLAAAPPRFALAGLSMGGYAAFEIMRQAPERVTRLALLDTTARPDTPAQTEDRRAMINLSRQGHFKGVTPRLLQRWIHPSRLADKALTEAVMSMTERVGREAFVRQQIAIMGRPDSRSGLSRIHCPTLVLCGHEDKATPVEVHREIAADIPNARLVVVPESGHLPPLERPEAVNAAMRAWLTAD
jgi:pimeloyl-ACP methyl ester carboxylesterase